MKTCCSISLGYATRMATAATLSLPTTISVLPMIT